MTNAEGRRIVASHGDPSSFGKPDLPLHVTLASTVKASPLTSPASMQAPTTASGSTVSIIW